MENTKELRKWLNDMDLGHPLVIAGPCSAETEEQVMRIAKDVKGYRCQLLPCRNLETTNKTWNVRRGWGHWPEMVAESEG